MLQIPGPGRLGVLAVLLFTSQQLSADDLLTADVLVEGLNVSHEFYLRGSATGEAHMKQGNKGVGDISSQDIAVKYVASVQVDEGPLFRIGGGYEGYWFERTGGPAISRRLDALSAVLGADFAAFDAWLFRVEAQPGYYGELGRGADFDDINCPFIAAATYIYDKDLQFVVGLQVDLWRDIPVFPAIGVRWKFSDALVLNFVPPNPRLEFFLSDKTMVYAGGQLLNGSFRVGPQTGNRGGQKAVNNAVLEYTEVRAGIGGVFNFTPTVSLDASVGAVCYRSYDYHRVGLTYHSDGAAPYGSLALTAKF